MSAGTEIAAEAEVDPGENGIPNVAAQIAAAKPHHIRAVRGSRIREQSDDGVRLARAGLSAPIFCAPSAETVESIDEGTRNTKLMIFSTIPTAAASVRPRRLAITVMTIKAIWINPSCMAMGKPMRRIRENIAFPGRKSRFEREIPISARRSRITTRERSTLIACDKVVPSAAPAGPRDSTPMKR